MRTRLARVLALALAAVAAVGVAPAQAELQLGIQDDALLTSQEPNAWPFAKGLTPKVVRYNIGWEQVAKARPKAPRTIRPIPPTTSSTPTRWPGRRRRSGRRACSRSSTRRAGPTATARPASRPSSADDYGQFCGVVAWRYSGTYTPPGSARPAARGEELHGLERAQPRPVPDAAGPRRADGRAHFAALVRACADAVHAVSPDARVAAGPIASRGAQGGAVADRLPRGLQQGRRPAAAGARVQPVHERPRAGLQAQGGAGRRRHHAAQPRPAPALAQPHLRRHGADLVHGVRVAHGPDAEARHHLARQAGRAPAQDGHARAHALPLREDARLVPRARRVAERLLALRPGDVRLASTSPPTGFTRRSPGQ